MADNAMLLEVGPGGPGLGGKRRAGAGEWRERLVALFPQAAAPVGRRPGWRLASQVIQVVVVCAGAGVMLLRVAGGAGLGRHLRRG